MKVLDARHLKRERLGSGIKLALERQLSLEQPDARDEVARFLLKEHQLVRILAQRYAECVRTALQGFPEGDIPEDVLESHVDALCFHDEQFARKLLPSDDLVVRALKGAATTVRRFYQWLDEADLFTLGGRQFKVTAVVRERAGDVDAEGAKREGFGSLEEWRRQWLDNLPRAAGTSAWSPDVICVRHDFVATS